MADAATLDRALDRLSLLLEIKVAAGEALERAAAVAPTAAFRDAFLALAAVDFRHAVEIRRLRATTATGAGE